ncbi:MAG: glucosamine-6-phosphate deaminase [Planctomycetes bacterium]|nr:glucosamine-6-phosphate deaminase [Planctomycetota bacterium]
MNVEVLPSKDELGKKAARDGAEAIRKALAERGEANVILATGASQFEMLGHLVKEPDIDWGKVTVFHLDEYAGMPITHPASFRKYLKERFVDQAPEPPREFHYINAEGDCFAECERLGKLIAEHPIDVAFIGIGENGHVAFNDPPADFSTEKPYLVVELDEACRRQQLGEGWFPTLDDVPKQAISMSVRQILKSKQIICSVPDERKTKAVQGAVEGPVTPDCPASILQEHEKCTIYLDPPSASLLKK